MDLSQIDKTTFGNISFFKKIEKPWGYELLLTPDDFPYMVKIIHVSAGKRTSLQIHDKKRETLVLVKGSCNMILDNTHGALIEIALEKLRSYSVNIGQRHRVHAITDCDLVEASTPETGITYRLEDDFHRDNETEEDRKEERKHL